MRILVTGGAGYVGRHVALALHRAGHEVELLDSLVRGTMDDVKELEQEAGARFPLHLIDVWLEAGPLKRLFLHRAFDAVVHLAGVKPGPGQSRPPGQCFAIEMAGTCNVVACMEAGGCTQLVTCSSDSVYGRREDGARAWKEEDWPAHAGRPCSAYGVAKDAVERMLVHLGSSWSIRILRCPEVVGALATGGLRDTDDAGIITRMLRATHGAPFHVHDGDETTPDGSGVRDYVHVSDAAAAHVCAVNELVKGGVDHYNVGTGKGTSVWQLLVGLQRVAGASIPCTGVPTIGDGNLGVRLADPRKLRRELGWSARHGIREICEHALAAHKKVSTESNGSGTRGASVGPD